MKTKYSRALFFTSLAILTVVGCGKSCSPKTVSSNTISVVVAFPIETLDPRYATSAAASRVSKLVYAPLFVIGDDLAPKPFLAEKYEFLDDKTVAVTLRKNLFFQNGEPLEAKDVVYTFGSLGSPDVLSPHAAKFDYVESLSEDGPSRVLFHLKAPFAPFLTDLAALGVVSKKSCLSRSKECRHENNGSGPFMVANWNSATETLGLKPFERWFEGAPKSSVQIRVVRDENTRMLELIGKKTDIVDGDFSPQSLIELRKHPFLRIVEMPGLGYSYLAFNVRGPKANDTVESEGHRTMKALADRQVRQAMAHAIDFDQIIDKILLGSAKRVSGLLPNGHWAKDSELRPPNFDPEKAKALLDQAGLKPRGKDNIRFSVTLSTTPDRTRQAIAMLYADFLKKVGIATNVRVKDWGALYQDMKDGNFEMFSAIWVPVTEPHLYAWVHHSKNIPTADLAGGNRHGYKNPEVDRLIELGEVTLDLEKRKSIYQHIERILLRDLPYIPLWNDNRITVFNADGIEHFQPDKLGSLLGLRKAQIKDTTP